MGTESMVRDLHCTQFQATVALCVYPLGFALVPLFSTAFSEEVGRRPIYLVTAFASVLCYVLAAMFVLGSWTDHISSLPCRSNTIHLAIVARALGGAFASTGATLVGGTITDIWEPAERVLFHLRDIRWLTHRLTSLGAAFQWLGPMVSGWIEYEPRLQWRWIQWLHAIFSGVYFVIAMFAMKETRQSIILRRLAQQMRKETGDPRYRARWRKHNQNCASLCGYLAPGQSRSTEVLLTEPIATSISVRLKIIMSGQIDGLMPQFLQLWVFFMWGVLFCLIR
ncbi:major facilitator superfamily domain-containing protein [Boletus reticuloceps]|uniref:Major facilitator superfamily domain-containing protein n=1 Tax=Boletus reticuloceps TaxID=495285 RepID=A0A8I2YMS8_9AGAM|nr:major facilitator superfamily domain-containing protein [Boletus reticuloceps]